MLKKWETLTTLDFKEITSEDAAVLVVGSLEQHGNHLPTGTDIYLGEEIAKRAGEAAKRRIYLLPSVAYGFSAHHMDFPGSVTLTQKTLCSLVVEIAGSVIEAGFTKIVFVISHGGNFPAVHMAVNELGITNPSCSVVMFKYWDFMQEFMAELRDSELGGIGHAGEMETSMMMYLYPKMVGCDWKMYRLACGNVWFHPDMFAKNKVAVYKRFGEISPFGNVGVCDSANAEKGRKILEYLAKEIGAFFDGFYEKRRSES